MALIYTKSAEKTLILSPREGYQRAFDFQDWTEIRLGMFYSGVTAADDNTTAGSEIVTYNTVADAIAFGLKNSDNTVIPGLATSTFVGLFNKLSSQSESNASEFFCNGGGSGSGLYVSSFNGATNITNNLTAQASFSYPAANGTTAYCGFLVLKMVMADRGLSTQNISMGTAVTSPVSGSDYSTAALRTAMNNASFGTLRTAQWNSGGVALTVPDSFYVRIPFYNNRLRISAMRASRYS